MTTWTREQLNWKADEINRLLDLPRERWDENGNQNVGHHYVQGAYGSVQLQRQEEHGARNVTQLFTKRELGLWMNGYLSALYDLKGA